MAKNWIFPGCVLNDTFQHVLYENAFSWKFKKLNKSIVWIGDQNLVQNSTKHTQCASEVSGENSCKILSLKVWNNPPLAPVPFGEFFGLMVKAQKRGLSKTGPKCDAYVLWNSDLTGKMAMFGGFV